MRFAAGFLVFVGFLFTANAQAKDFPIFDGQYYNGLYYPRIDVVEWGDAAKTHLEFHIYSKNEPVDVAAEVGMKNGKPVVWLNYHLKSRGENVCRVAVAPPHFREGDKLFAYQDLSDTDYNNIYFSKYPIKDAKLRAYTIPAYTTCDDEFAVNKEGPDSKKGSERKIASQPPAQGKTEESVPAAKKPGGLVDYDNAAVPFSF